MLSAELIEEPEKLWLVSEVLEDLYRITTGRWVFADIELVI
jgi:hypothetical protein